MAELQNERYRFWDERRGAPLGASARFDGAIRLLAEGVALWRQAHPVRAVYRTFVARAHLLHVFFVG